MPFDFEAFISGAALAQAPVSAYRVDNGPAIKALRAQLDALPRSDEREAADTERATLERRIADLTSEMESSRVEWMLRAVGPDELKELRENDALDDYDQLAVQSRLPEGCRNPDAYADLPQLAADQWRAIAAAIGAVQWAQIVNDATNLILHKVAVPDFSPNTSTTPSQPDS